MRDTLQSESVEDEQKAEKERLRYGIARGVIYKMLDSFEAEANSNKKVMLEAVAHGTMFKP
jgi:hypothetical protein